MFEDFIREWVLNNVNYPTSTQTSFSHRFPPCVHQPVYTAINSRYISVLLSLNTISQLTIFSKSNRPNEGWYGKLYRFEWADFSFQQSREPIRDDAPGKPASYIP